MLSYITWHVQAYFTKFLVLYRHLVRSGKSPANSFSITMVTWLLFRRASVQVMADYLTARDEGYQVVAKAFTSGSVCGGFTRLYDIWYGIPYRRVDRNKTDLVVERYTLGSYRTPPEISSEMELGTLFCVRDGEFVKLL